MKNLIKKYHLSSLKKEKTSFGKEYIAVTARGKEYCISINSENLWSVRGFNFMNDTDERRFPKSIGYLSQDLCKLIN